MARFSIVIKLKHALRTILSRNKVGTELTDCCTYQTENL